jgi:hypothetical protein
MKIFAWLRRTCAESPAEYPPSIPNVHREWATTPQRYVVMHIPKTAGTTLRRILSEAFPCDVFPSTETLAANNQRYTKFTDLLHQPELVSRHRFVIGHYRLPQLLQLFPDRQIITCLREPFSRAVSVIGHHWRVHGIPPEAFLKDARLVTNNIVDQQTRFLAGQPSDWSGGYSEDMVKQALQNLERVKIVGIQERFPQFIARLDREFNLPAHTNLDRRDNVGTTNLFGHLEPYAEQIRERIAGDLELYRQVCLRMGSEQVP